jgi:hypothetical protein
MTAIIDWEDVTGRYPELSSLRDATRAGSYYIPFAIAELEGCLSQGYAVPFSLNNITAKDLAIDLVFAKIYRFKDEKKSAAVSSYIGGRIEDLLKGAASMQTIDGTVLPNNGDPVFSTTIGEHPVFGLSPPLLWQVDSLTVLNEEGARGRTY